MKTSRARWEEEGQSTSARKSEDWRTLSYVGEDNRGVKERNVEGQITEDFAKRMEMIVGRIYIFEKKKEKHRGIYKSGEKGNPGLSQMQVMQSERDY